MVLLISRSCYGVNKKRTGKCGTIEYFSPEIVVGHAYDKNYDEWSLGVFLYEICHGQSPFSAKTT